ncbi:MAG: hypothetical protein K0R55_2704, partial [Sporomusa sp.]|nr:hypothetical protein [Sporomusa sp.]
MFNPGIAILIGIFGLCIGVVFTGLFKTPKEHSDT